MQVYNSTKPKHGAPLPRFLSETEAQRFLEASSALRPAEFAYIATLYYSGLRRNEARMLDLADVDIASGTITVRHGKGGRQRMVPLHPTLKVILETWLEDRRAHKGEAALFITVRGRRPSYVTTWEWMHAAAKLIPGTAISAHWLRHTAATMMLRRGGNIRALQRILGHARLDTTAIYTNLVMDDLRDTIAKLA